MRRLTQNGDGDSFADRWRDSVARDAIINAHVTFGHLSDPQYLALETVLHARRDVLVVFARPIT